MIIITGNGKTLNLKIGFSKTKLFIKEQCKKNESILEIVSNAMANNDLEFLTKFCVHYQDGTKYTENEIDEILEDYFISDKDGDVISLYKQIITEFDVNGLIQKGMGLLMLEKMDQAMKKLEKDLKKDILETPTDK